MIGLIFGDTEFPEEILKTVKKRKIKSETLSAIIDNTKFKEKKINFLNIDTEGSDLEILKNYIAILY